MERKIIKRSWLGISGYLVFEALFLKGASHFNPEDIEIIHIVNIIGAIVIMVLIVKFTFYPYIIFEGKSISILHNFSKDVFSVENVIEIETSEGFFKLKNGKKMRFNEFMLNKRSIESIRIYYEDSLHQ